jgi:beta-1,4-mannosyl-glycoprotein beta-1,4-N-acetylglucosaminyltransferase
MIYEVIYTSNELDILDIQLHELNDVVDKFIIIENPFDYLRNPKRMVFYENRNRFKEFDDKIIHIIDDLPYGNQLGLDLMWSRTDSPILYALLTKIQEDAFIIFSNSDVVLKKEVVKNLDITKPSVFYMDWYESFFDQKSTTTIFKWTVGIPLEYIKQYGILQSHRLTRKEIPSDFESIIIENSGYHFSKCGDLDDLVEHIKGHPHIELATNTKICNKEWLKNRRDLIKKWDDISSDNEINLKEMYEIIPYDSKNYPDYINKNPQIFEKYFRKGM